MAGKYTYSQTFSFRLNGHYTRNMEQLHPDQGKNPKLRVSLYFQ